MLSVTHCNSYEDEILNDQLQGCRGEMMWMAKSVAKKLVQTVHDYWQTMPVHMVHYTKATIVHPGAIDACFVKFALS
jgi:hypothetical protein